jgi:aromatic ring-opening dioxygenase LigB subunit
MVRRGALDELVDIPREEVSAALADSWWQMLMLVGAMRESGAPYQCQLLAYEAPTYYGMLTAVLTPRA